MALKTVPCDSDFLLRAGRWFLHSGIQEPGGGVARYYRSDSRENLPVSTEITGYAVSTLVWLFDETGERSFLDAAIAGGRFLTRVAWQPASATFPFELPREGAPTLAYFFDCGIIVRALLALWRASGEAEFLERAKEAAVAMAFDFFAPEAAHPVIVLPEKEPLDYENRWSRSPGCYQLKSAMAWRELADVTGEASIASAYERMLSWSLETHASFLPGTPERPKVMDRLHAYCYFLEALLPVADRPECARALAEGIARVGRTLRDIAPEFARSDVYGQLLRVRIYAHALGAVPLSVDAAAEEAAAAASFQAGGDDRPIAGGFWFGSRHGEPLPFVNPVSTAFCTQALAYWEQFRKGDFPARISGLI